jgi:DNA-binding response OmpR family regulator
MKGKKLLIVEDDPKSLYALKMVLQDRGFQVVACDSAEAAADLAAERFDAAILDVRLPGAHGTDVAARLRRSHPATRIVFVTAYNGVKSIEGSFPGAHVLVKPLDLEALVRLL